MIRFRVAGRPAPQGSKRHVGGGRMVESSRAVGPWREAVRAEAQHARGQQLHGALSNQRTYDATMALRDAPLSVTVVFALPRPAGHYGTGRNAGQVRASAPRFPATRPDVDKLARAVLDGLVMGGVMADDSQVINLHACKVYARDGEAPGALIEVEAMT